MDINNPRLRPGNREARDGRRKDKPRTGSFARFGKLDAVAGEKYIPLHTVIDFFQIPTIINCSGGFPTKFGSADARVMALHT